MARVFASLFFPATEYGGVGGFHWNTDLTLARKIYRENIRDFGRSDDDTASVVRLVELDISSDLRDHDAVAEEIDAMLHDAESTMRAIRQYVPKNVQPGYAPVGGALKHDEY